MTYSLIECTGAYGTTIGLLPCVYSLMFSEGTSIGESFPTKAATVRPFTGMNTDVYLLRTATAESLAAFSARERTSTKIFIMRMTMAH